MIGILVPTCGAWPGFKSELTWASWAWKCLLPGESILLSNKKDTNFRLIHGGEVLRIDIPEGVANQQESLWVKYHQFILDNYTMDEGLRDGINEDIESKEK